MDRKVLIIGIGNISRGDDGLGWAFIDAIREWCPYDMEYRYQLQVEDAELVRHYQRVIFVDGTKEHFQNGYSFRPCVPAANFTITTHRIDPSAIVWLSDDLYDERPEAYILAIEGECWDLGAPLSKYGKENLSNSVSFFKKMMKELKPAEDRWTLQMNE